MKAKTRNTNKVIMAGIFGILMFLLVGNILLVSAKEKGKDFWACFDYGEVRSYCSDYRPPKTCGYTNGCSVCMSEYRASEDCYVGGNYDKCLKLPQECTVFDGNTSTFDITPPELTINSPVQNGVYGSRKVLLDFEINEESDVYYLDLLNGRGRWTRVCTDCMSYSRERSFKEGQQNLTFRAKDAVGLFSYVNVSFFVDSKKPRISKTFPRKGFADGNFEVQFRENNPESLILSYGNSIRTEELDIEENCYLDRRKYYCSTTVNLSDFDGGQIKYWFNLTDIAGTSVESKHVSLSVDTTFPVINNPDSFWEQGEGRYNKYIYFKINITELNFDEVSYTYIDNRGRVKEKRLCSRLRDEICEKKKSFRKGVHDLTINVKDKAGNSIGVPISFSV